MAIIKCCPQCGCSLNLSRGRSNLNQPQHPGADASKAAIYAYYKATAPVEDIKFLLRPSATLSAALRLTIEDALANRPTAADAARMRYLVRIERLQAERARRTAAYARLARMRARLPMAA